MSGLLTNPISLPLSSHFFHDCNTAILHNKNLDAVQYTESYLISVPKFEYHCTRIVQTAREGD